MEKDQSTQPRKVYERPSLERVLLDPVKEMLTACSTDPNAKNTTDCVLLITSLS